MSKLGTGSSGPWENRSHVIKLGRHPNSAAVGLHLNAEFAVQRFRYPEHPGWDLLTVNRQDETDSRHPGWKVLQGIKDRLAPDGPERFGFEVFPPTRWIIDNCDLWHVWVMPLGEEPGIGFHDDQQGGGLRI